MPGGILSLRFSFIVSFSNTLVSILFFCRNELNSKTEKKTTKEYLSKTKIVKIMKFLSHA